MFLPRGYANLILGHRQVVELAARVLGAEQKAVLEQCNLCIAGRERCVLLRLVATLLLQVFHQLLALVHGLCEWEIGDSESTRSRDKNGPVNACDIQMKRTPRL